MDIIYKKTSQTEDIILVGAMDKGIVVSLAPNDSYFGIRFKPSILSFLLNQKMNKYSNKIVSLKDVSIEFYNKFNSFREKDILNIEKLNILFEEKISRIQIDNRIVDSIDFIEKHQGDIKIKDLIKKVNISQRQLERLLLNHLGYYPKRIIRVIRFYNIHKNIIKNGTKNLSSVANDYGYCDQAHFNKEYKEFTNFSPKDENMSILYNTRK
jgi:AraC-like DNA-binding protein